MFFPIMSLMSRDNSLYCLLSITILVFSIIYHIDLFTYDYNKLHVNGRTNVFKKQCVRCTDYSNVCTPVIFTNISTTLMSDTQCDKRCINFENITCYDGYMYFYHNNTNICNMCIFADNYNYTYAINFNKQNITRDIVLNQYGECTGFYSTKLYYMHNVMGYMFVSAIFTMIYTTIVVD